MSSQTARQRLFPHRLRQDLALVGTRLQRAEPRGLRDRAYRISADCLAVPARSRLPGVSRLRRLALADAAHRLCRPNLARPCRADGGRRVHRRHSLSRDQRAVLDHAAGGGAGRGAARRHVRPAVAAAARALSRGQHAGAAFRRDLSRRRIRNAARLLDRHHHRSAQARRPSRSPTAAPGTSSCCSRRWRRCSFALNLLRAAPGAPGAQFARARPWPRRSASASPATSCSPS